MSNDLSKNAAFAEVDDLLNATMDDLDGLPPMAIPPTGLYTLEVSITRELQNEKDALVAKYKVIGVSEVADESEASDVVVGQIFQNGTYTKTKDGKVNEFGIAAFKDSLVPYAKHFFGDSYGSVSIGQIIEKVNELQIAAKVLRKQRKGGAEDEYNFRMKDIIVM